MMSVKLHSERNNYAASRILTPATPRKTLLLTGSGVANCRGLVSFGPGFLLLAGRTYGIDQIRRDEIVRIIHVLSNGYDHSAQR